MRLRNRKQERPRRQEEQVADELGGRRVPASGSLPFNPGDAITDRYLVDAKESDTSFSITKRVIDKVTKEAALKGRTPLLQVTLSSVHPYRAEWYVVPKHEFLELLRAVGIVVE